MKKKYEINMFSYGSSLKICKVAEGVVNIYPRLAPTMEWDTAAAQFILEESGGYMLNPLSGKKLEYNNYIFFTLFLCLPPSNLVLINTSIHLNAVFFFVNLDPNVIIFALLCNLDNFVFLVE